MAYGIAPPGQLAGQLERFGDDSARMILQTGQMITQGLQQMMTNRQIQGLGTELSSLNPESPDWAQKAVQLGSRYPLAMKSEAGQFMLGTQAKAHAEWTQAQRATQQNNLMFGRQMGLENLRTANDIRLEDIKQKNRMELGGGGVDLSGVPLPQSLDGNTPGNGISFGTDETQPQPQESVAGNPLTGMSGLLPDISGALGPLATAQKMTGVKFKPVQIASAVAADQTRKQQEKMLEDRQRQQEAMAEKTRLASEEAANVRATRSEEASNQRFVVQDLQGHRRSAVSNLTRAAKEFEDSYDAKEEKKAKNEEYFRNRKRLQSEVTLAQKELESIDAEIAGVLRKGESKTLTKAEAAAILKEAGGDKEKARALARERGFTL